MSLSLLPPPSQVDALSGHRAAIGGASAHAGSRGVPTLLCAAGRGGSGTTLISALIAVAAAGDGYRVLLVDADEHVGPLSLLLGVKPRSGWQDLRGGRIAPQDAATPISTTLTLVAGGAARLAGSSRAPLTAAERRACMLRVSALGHGDRKSVV